MRRFLISSAIPVLHYCERDKGKNCNYDYDDIFFCHDFLLLCLNYFQFAYLPGMTRYLMKKFHYLTIFSDYCMSIDYVVSKTFWTHSVKYLYSPKCEQLSFFSSPNPQIIFISTAVLFMRLDFSRMLRHS